MLQQILRAPALKAILTGVLFFGGVCCAVFLGGSAQKKLQALIQEQFGDFFRAEWEKAFGPDMHTPEMRIDEPFMRALHLLDGTIAFQRPRQSSQESLCIFLLSAHANRRYRTQIH